MTPWITVAVCTRNRAALLADALERLTVIRPPARLPWEVLVVDNGSTDTTPAVVAGFGGRLPLRSVIEPRPGVAHARNAAVSAAAGTYVLWLDDDELVSLTWLSDYAEATRAYPTVDVFGGPIVPWYEGWGTTPPPWLAAAMGAVPGLARSYGALDLGPTPRPLAATEHLWNGNLMVRTAAHRQVPYDPAFGRRPASQRGGEEVELLTALRRRGATTWWVPSAWLHHVIPTARQSARFLRGHYQGLGEQDEIRRRRETGRGLSRRGRGFLWRVHVEHQARFGVLRLARGPERWIMPLMIAAIARGHLRADRQMRYEQDGGEAR